MKVQELLIRPFDAVSDTETLSAIWFDASLVVHDFIGEKLLIEQRKLVEDEYFPKSETWVACDAGRPVGFVSLLDTFIGAIFVAPDQQGKGVGRKLISHALALKNELSLEVYTANERAMHFYRTLGFEEVSRRPTDDQGLPFENAHLRIKR